MSLEFSGYPTQVMRDDQLALPASIVTIGAFDGVHRGHQALISQAVAEARFLDLPSVVWTFDPPPKVFFGRAQQLAPVSEKLARIAQLGPDHIVLAHFCRSYAQRSPDAFLADLSRIGPRRIHVGSDFRFGANQFFRNQFKDGRGNVSVGGSFTINSPNQTALVVACQTCRCQWRRR